MNHPEIKPEVKKKWTLYKKWQVFAPTSLLLTGFGLCLFGMASNMVREDVPFIKWFLPGLLSLIVFNTGLVLLAEAIKSRTLYEMRLKKRRRIKVTPKKHNPSA
jgi:hypothetical protein